MPQGYIFTKVPAMTAEEREQFEREHPDRAAAIRRDIESALVEWGPMQEQPRDVNDALNIVLDLYELDPKQRAAAKADMLRVLESYG